MELGGFGREYRAMILFAGYVGLRPGELFALRRDDLEGHLCLIERSPSKTGKIGPTKTSGACTVIVPPPAQDALRDVPLMVRGSCSRVRPTACGHSPLHHGYCRC